MILIDLLFQLSLYLREYLIYMYEYSMYIYRIKHIYFNRIN